ncbi:MAG: adenylyltransferase/cytidyltransferase family protein [Prevotella sp.]|nr:adenylyltransferase/cytidyltransferase family protein [Prevotella sp.]
MKKVFTVGVYDLLHIGHILLFKNAKALGDELTVAVQSDECILKYKPEAKMVNTSVERMFMVSSIRYVDHVVSYDDVDEIIKHVDFDVFAKGPDQTHVGFQRAVEWCRSHGKEVVVIPRTDGISSSMLREVELIKD